MAAIFKHADFKRTDIHRIEPEITNESISPNLLDVLMHYSHPVPTVEKLLATNSDMFVSGGLRRGGRYQDLGVYIK